MLRLYIGDILLDREMKTTEGYADSECEVTNDSRGQEKVSRWKSEQTYNPRRLDAITASKTKINKQQQQGHQNKMIFLAHCRQIQQALPRGRRGDGKVAAPSALEKKPRHDSRRYETCD